MFLDLIDVHYGNDPKTSPELKSFRNRVAAFRQVRNDRSHAAAANNITPLEADIAVGKVLDLFLSVIVPAIDRNTDLFRPSTRNAVQSYVDELVAIKSPSSLNGNAQRSYGARSRTIMATGITGVIALIAFFTYLWTRSTSQESKANTQQADQTAPWHIAILGSQGLNEIEAAELSNRLKNVIDDSAIVAIQAFGGDGLMETQKQANVDGFARFIERNSRTYYHWRDFGTTVETAINSLYAWTKSRGNGILVVIGDLPQFTNHTMDSLRRSIGSNAHILLPRQELYPKIKTFRHVWIVRTSNDKGYIADFESKLQRKLVTVTDVYLGSGR